MAIGTIVFIITLIIAIIFAIIAIIMFILWQTAIGDCENDTTRCPIIEPPPPGQALCLLPSPCPPPP